MALEPTHQTVVRSSCLTCGTVDLGIADVAVLLDSSGGTPRYTFTCPECASFITKPTTAEAVRLLREAGVPILTGPGGAADSSAGAVLTEDDLIAFGRALLEADDLARFAATAH